MREAFPPIQRSSLFATNTKIQYLMLPSEKSDKIGHKVQKFDAENEPTLFYKNNFNFIRPYGRGGSRISISKNQKVLCVLHLWFLITYLPLFMRVNTCLVLSDACYRRVSNTRTLMFHHLSQKHGGSVQKCSNIGFFFAKHLRID